MKRILCLFDYGPECRTGYATVSRNLVKQLKEHFGDKLGLDIVACNYFDKPYTEYDNTVRILSGKMTQRLESNVPDQFKHGDDFGRIQFLDMLKGTDYDGIFMLQDLGVIAPIMPLIKEIYDGKVKRKVKAFNSMIYFPVDGLIHPKVKNRGWSKQQFDSLPSERKPFFVDTQYIRQVRDLNFFERVVTYTNYAKAELVKHEPGLKDNIEVIYHGINTEDFFPMQTEDKKQFRKEYFGKNADKLIVGVVNRNQPRKDIPTAIFGFIEAMDGYKAPESKELFLYLHMDPDDPKGWRLRELLSLTKLVEGRDYMFPVGGDHNQQVSVEQLNRIYNSLDMYLSTATGEGWGLSITEAMACKVPCIIPEHTSMKEIGADDRAYFMEEFLPVSTVDDNVKRWMCHYDEVAEKIHMVAQALIGKEKPPDEVPTFSPDINKVIDNAYQWVTELTWENVCREWVDNFEEVYIIA